MEKALQRLADAKMTKQSESPSSTDVQTETNAEGFQKVQISVVDTPPTTPTTATTASNNNYVNPALKGIPKALLERVNNFYIK